mgnify:FL=1
MARRRPATPDGPAAKTPASSGRRRVLGWLWGVLGAIVTFEAVWIVGSFLRPRQRSVEADDALVVAGPVERFVPGTVTAFPGGRFYLACLEDGGFLALDRTCTHLGCTVPWNADTGRFECPCHASSFDIGGSVLAAPAPRPLDSYPVRVENGVVKVDTGRRIRRDEFDPAQVARA